jgi:hypothetical protein
MRLTFRDGRLSITAVVAALLTTELIDSALLRYLPATDHRLSPDAHANSVVRRMSRWGAAVGFERWDEPDMAGLSVMGLP